MKSNPLVSIIIPVYNVENYLEKSLDSVINQSYKNLEIILVDDGSTDNSGKICDDYLKKDSRINVIHQKNKGTSEARNKALKQANGEYISFVDSDDILDLQFIEVLLHNAIKNQADISGCKFEVVKEQKIKKETSPVGQEKVYTKIEYIDSLLKDKINFSCCTKLFKSKHIKKLTFPKNKKYEDMLFLIQAVDQSKTYVETTEALYFYIVRKNSNTTSIFNLQQLDFIKNVDEICTFLKQKYNINDNLCNRKKIQARVNILHKMLIAKVEKNEISKLQQEIKILYVQSENKNFFSKKDKISIWLVCHSLIGFKTIFSIYLKLKPHISVFKKR